MQVVPEAIRVDNRIQRAWEANPTKHQYAKVEKPKGKKEKEWFQEHKRIWMVVSGKPREERISI